jgi:non-homologous end joining protein Ku
MCPLGDELYENAWPAVVIRSKQAGLPARKEKPSSRPANLVNLMDALKHSIEGTGKASKATAGKQKPAAPEAQTKRHTKKAARG